ncbi:MAG: DUF6785 family protein [Planctomycetota bacterium]
MEEAILVTPHRGFTLRSLVIGAVLSFLLNVACPYCVLIMKNAGLTSDYITAGAVMLFFVLVVMLNPLLKLFCPRHALSAAELVLIYVMMIIASAIPTWGLVTNMFHILTRPFYYASPENDWENLFIPQIPAWLAPHAPHVSRWFYEGLPAGESIPWGEWAIPLFWWTTQMMAIYLVMIAAMVIMRKQWVEHERLAFPIIQPPLEMLRGNDENIVNPLFRNRLTWFAFIFTFAIVSINGLSYYFPSVPDLTFRRNFWIFRRTTHVLVFWNFAIVGLTYFINLDVAASFWVFHLLSKIETGILNVTGYTLEGHHDPLTGSSAATSYQGMGAMIVLVIFALWSARGHIRKVLRKALKNDAKIDDSEEILSYRAAVLVFLLASIYCIGWFAASGMPIFGAAVFYLGSFGIFFALTRIVAQGGVGFTAAQMIPQPFTVYAIGTEALQPSGITSLGFTWSYAAEMRTSVMTSAMNGLKLSDSAEARGRRLFWAMMVAIVAGLAGAVWITVTLNYKYGGANMRQFGVPTMAFNFVVDKIKYPVGKRVILERWLHTGIGAAAMAGLVFLRNRVMWWPVHYVGYCIGDAWVMGWAWFGVFIGWLLKLSILSLGGQHFYQRMKPLFLGMILGQIMCGAFWIGIDLITGEVGNYVYIGVP